MHRIVWTAALAIMLFGRASQAAPAFEMAPPQSLGFDPAKLRLLDDAMDRAVDTDQVAGIEIMAVRHGKIADLHMYGIADMNRDTPIARDTIFRMYSQTKPMIGVAMMVLYEKGLWTLDDPVTKFVPEFANLKVLAGTNPDGTMILEDMKRPPTMRELMTHTAGFGYGLRAGDPVDDMFRDQKVLQSNGLQDMIDKIAKIPLLYQPGTRWSYSIAADIQGYIIQKLSGEPLGQFMQEHIWGPLGMLDTGFFVPPANAARLSGVYVISPQTHKPFQLTTELFHGIQDFTKPPSMESGGGGSVSTVDDYGLFCQMMLNKGELNGVRIISPESVALMEENQIETGVQPTAPMGGRAIGEGAIDFGLDFAITEDPAKLGIKQSKGSIWWGGAAGTWFWIDPKDDLFFLGMVQRFGGGAAGDESLGAQSQSLLYSALTDPAR
jgi:CubicO group peptidase (beta-lactamase class C family)